VVSGGKSALSGKCKLVEGSELCVEPAVSYQLITVLSTCYAYLGSLVYSSYDIVLVFKVGDFAANETQDDGLLLGQESERFEIAGPVVVEFEVVYIGVHW
jgi:hypothetical protein